MSTIKIEKLNSHLNDMRIVGGDVLGASLDSARQLFSYQNLEKAHSDEREMRHIATLTALGVVGIGANIVYCGFVAKEEAVKAASRVVPIAKETKKLVRPLFPYSGPKPRRSQLLRNKNRFVPNPENVNVDEYIITVADSGTPIGHEIQEDLRI